MGRFCNWIRNTGDTLVLLRTSIKRFKKKKVLTQGKMCNGFYIAGIKTNIDFAKNIDVAIK